ncbi:hybrid sensor histidine kinase/response regulator [Lyngbya confervoides]|uniref:histidine kinase n=1 Tax=Lyngbya confervoides BDU141951 TaxID=1574623 RepID=A0ABD4T1L4_9CYAN|nr:hybrid sensor histidine kinase/response regulator [Lyngbya confervoides]MCM1982656.1 hybrid sensor histidine kinase/response regulator [Lyngbya confervoides BDU141951]
MPPFSAVLQNQTSRVLVVDDLPDNSFLIQAILIDEGYEIQVEDNGFTALEQIKQNPPDLLILDVMMPHMDGYEITQKIRQDSELPIFPILLITAHDTPSAVMGLDVGADDFIRKPVEVAELLARVRSLLRLKHTMDERDRIARQREDFVSRLTHDLRTPLVAADRMLELILEEGFGPLSPDLQEILATMASSNQNLLDLVNNLLQVYRFESGLYPLEFTSLDLGQVIRGVMQELTPLCERKGLEISCSIQSEPLKLTGDRLEIRRLLTNLLGNAIKFTSQGEIRVQVLRHPQGAQYPDAPAVEIQVADTGIGIPQPIQADLFERFKTGGHSACGSGLGLHVSRYIVEAHQGTIQVISTPGVGSTFTVMLPQVQQSLALP